MSVLYNPTLNDLCLEALREAGVVGDGMQASASQLARAMTRISWTLQQWARSKSMIFAVQTQIIDIKAVDFYTVAAGTQGGFSSDFNSAFATNDAGLGEQSRPERLEAVFFRQTNVSGNQGPIDYPLEQLEDGGDFWAKTRMKGLTSWPQMWYYQPEWPIGKLYIWPKAIVGQGYQLGIVFRIPVDFSFATYGTQVVLPPEYHSALVLSTAMFLRSSYQIPSFPGDALPAAYKKSMSVIKSSNVRVARLQMPGALQRGRARYNPYSDNIG